MYALANTTTANQQNATLPSQNENTALSLPAVPVLQQKQNDTGLPDDLKTGVEELSGYSMDDVKVHYNSDKPAQLNALAYAQGTDIHIGSGQEKHLPHEAWHVAQQKQGRVQATMQMKEGIPVNDDSGLEKEADEMGAKALQTKTAFHLKPVQQKSGSTNNNSLTQFKLENTKINQDLKGHKSTIENYASKLSTEVENARSMVATKYFVHVPPSDGYMQNFVDNFDDSNNKFINPSAVPMQAGYWIESYVTKIVALAAGGGLDVLLQAKRGNSRPDVILQSNKQDVAWLDITSTNSEGHIYDKNSEGWNSTPYVTEVTYDGLKVIDLNKIAVPGKDSVDLSALIERANKVKQQQLEWEATLIERKGLELAKLLAKCYEYIKGEAVKAEESEMEDDSFDKSFSPDMPGNRFETWALYWMKAMTGKAIEAKELASLLLYWKGMIQRYTKRFPGAKLPPEFNLPTKGQLGLSWVDDSSSADGEPLIRDLFPV